MNVVDVLFYYFFRNNRVCRWFCPENSLTSPCYAINCTFDEIDINWFFLIKNKKKAKRSTSWFVSNIDPYIFRKFSPFVSVIQFVIRYSVDTFSTNWIFQRRKSRRWSGAAFDFYRRERNVTSHTYHRPADPPPTPTRPPTFPERDIVKNRMPFGGTRISQIALISRVRRGDVWPPPARDSNVTALRAERHG